MTMFFLSVAEITVTMSVAVILVLFLFRLFGAQIKASSRYWILVLILVRLAIPIGFSGIPALLSFEIDVTDNLVFYPSAQDSSSSAETVPLPHPPEGESALPRDPVYIPTTAKEDSAFFGEFSVGESDKPSFSTLLTFLHAIPVSAWLQIILQVYVLIAVLCLIVPLFSHLFYVHRIKIGRTLNEEQIYSRYVAVARQSGIKNPPLLWLSRAADSPMIIGLFTPRLILPETITEDALDGILAHELKHYTRRDLWVKFLCMIVRALHWFNPIVHIAVKHCFLEMELSCDAAILSLCSLEERQAYGFAMLKIVRDCRNKGMAMTTHFSPRKTAVKARFAGIVDMNVKKNGTWMIATAVLLCMISGSILACTLKTEAADSTESNRILATYSEENYSITEYQNDDATVQWDVRLANGQCIVHTLDATATYRPSIQSIAYFEDVNFDGNIDLLLCRGGNDGWGTVYYDCYLFDADSYVLCDSFSQIANPVAEAKKHLIYSTYHEKDAGSMTATYVYKDEAFVLQRISKTATYMDVFYFTDFSSEDALNDFTQYRGEWVIRDGRLWLNDFEYDWETEFPSSAFLLYNGEESMSLANYQVDIDIYNLQAQVGVLTRCDLNQAHGTTANSFYGYFHFVSKNCLWGAIGFGDKNGDWGGNILVQSGKFGPGDDIHLRAIVFENTIRCIYTEIDTGTVLLDIKVERGLWTNGTFGIRMFGGYEERSSLNRTSFDNLKVTRLS